MQNERHAETIWRLTRSGEVAELILRHLHDRWELLLLFNGIKSDSQLFRPGDAGWHRVAANHRHVLEMQGWNDGRRLSGVRWKAVAHGRSKGRR